MTRLVPLLLGAVAIGYMAVKGCQEGPFGRNQIVALNPEQEMALGAQAFEQVLRQSDVVAEGPLVDAVRRVVNRLIAAAEKPDFLEPTKVQPQKFRWDVRVVRNQQVNAFCLPGGKMVVYTGILPVAETEAGLAVVMGHEIAHALAHHGAERMAQQQLVQIGQTAAAGSIADLDPHAQRQILGLIGAGAKFGLVLPYSRNHESEADRLGLYLMAVAGYDPLGAPKFWQRMSKVGGGKAPPEFASTHPSHERRVAELENWQSEVRSLFQKAQPAPGGERKLPAAEGRAGWLF
jgi:predicted Zn-dependent protease